MAKQLEALTTIERGRAEKTIEKGTIFKAESKEQEDELFRLGAVREAPKGATEGMRTSLSDNPSPEFANDSELEAAEAALRSAETALREDYERIYGKKPHANMKFDTIRAQVAEKESGNANVKASAEAESTIARLTAADEDGKSGSDAAEAPRGTAASGGATTDDGVI